MQLGNVFNFILKEYSFGWRISIGVEPVVGGFLALGMFLLPRSPRSHDHSPAWTLVQVYCLSLYIGG